MSKRFKTYVAPEEYLARERKAEYKSEYFDGEIVAFAGATREHNLIVGNAAGELRSHLKSKACEVYSSDMRVRIGSTRYVYPDIVVVCGQPSFADNLFDTLLNPTLLVEVLSESTELYDRNLKSGYYRTIESLKEYLFIAQRACQVEQYTRQPDGRWLISDIRSLDDVIELESIGCTLALREVYDKVSLDTADSE
jgi:Uma2 family endonuclease